KNMIYLIDTRNTFEARLLQHRKLAFRDFCPFAREIAPGLSRHRRIPPAAVSGCEIDLVRALCLISGMRGMARAFVLSPAAIIDGPNLIAGVGRRAGELTAIGQLHVDTLLACLLSHDGAPFPK